MHAQSCKSTELAQDCEAKQLKLTELVNPVLNITVLRTRERWMFLASSNSNMQDIMSLSVGENSAKSQG